MKFLLFIAVLFTKTGATRSLGTFDNETADLVRRLGKPTCTDGSCRKTCAECCPGANCDDYEADCGGTGICSSSCGNGTCDENEDCSNCEADCGACPIFQCPSTTSCVCDTFPDQRIYCTNYTDCPLQTYYDSPKCTKTGEPCTGTCSGNGNHCRSEQVTVQSQCELPVCGDSNCDAGAGETCSTCPLDCGGACATTLKSEGEACNSTSECLPGLMCEGAGVCVETCCGAWCKTSPLLGYYHDTVQSTLEAWMATDQTSGCSSGSGCTCVLSASIANTWTIVTGNICDAHNFNPTCTDWGNCQQQCDEFGPVVIGGRLENGKCICMATANGVTKDVWDSGCVENSDNNLFHSCT